MFLAEMKVVALLVSRRGTKCCCANRSGSPRANGSSSPTPSVMVIVPTTSNLVPVLGKDGAIGSVFLSCSA